MSVLRLLPLFMALSGSLGGASPQRIVSLSPDLTELIYGVGAFDRVVGVSDYATYPPAVADLARVGGWRDPNLEKVAALRPDLAVLDDGQATFIVDNLKQLGVQVMVCRVQSVDDVFAAITAIGVATGHQAEAERLSRQTRDGLTRVSRSVGSSRPSVALVVDRTPGTLRDLVTPLSGTFLADLVEIAGGRIVAPAGSGRYAQLSKETLVAIDPDIILDFDHTRKSLRSGDPSLDWQDLPELKAVRTRRVYRVNDEFVLHATQRMVQTAELFARLIHPEAR